MKITTKALCACVDISRQAYYRWQKTQWKMLAAETIVLSEIRRLRREQTRVGGRKLQQMLRESGLHIGRDRLFAILKKHGLLVKPRKRFVKTTQADDRFRMHPNRIKDLAITRSNQVYVADITYLDTREGFCYLSLITDAYSRKIVGFDLSDNLRSDGVCRALKMALRGVSEPQKLIHHSDRGFQYCSQSYTEILQQHGVQISMTEEDHVYENALAERVNGILKDEFLLGEKLRDYAIAKELVTDSINIYNTKRLHMSLNYKTPEEIHRKVA